MSLKKQSENCKEEIEEVYQTLEISLGQCASKYENHEITIHDLKTNVSSLPFSALSLKNSLSTNLNQNISKSINSTCDDTLMIDFAILNDLEIQARSISSNIDMALRDLRGSLRGMSDLTLESAQTFSSSISSSCDTMDASVKLIYSILAKTDELNNLMKGINNLSAQM